MRHSGTREEALVELLVELFTGYEIWSHLAIGPDGGAIVADIPSPIAPPREIATAAVLWLCKRGKVDEAFFCRLRSQRAKRTADVDAVYALWLPGGQSDAQWGANTAGQTACSALLEAAENGVQDAMARYQLVWLLCQVVREPEEIRRVSGQVLIDGPPDGMWETALLGALRGGPVALRGLARRVRTTVVPG